MVDGQRRKGSGCNTGVYNTTRSVCEKKSLFIITIVIIITLIASPIDEGFLREPSIVTIFNISIVP